MKRNITVFILFFLPVFAKCQASLSSHISQEQYHRENDSLVWKSLSTFSRLFNNADTIAMKQFLPDDFLLQWMHENFISKRAIINAMHDSAVHATMKHNISVFNHKAIVRYSDDYSAVSINTSFDFTDPEVVSNIKKQNGYGVCIAYLQKVNGRWLLKTIHLDLHCFACNF
ncbi:MAG: hypothetical protein JST96_01510 [Bacteroidetes bacterium]|nr:hypothetical protein [Bacteroidota bacterium]